MFYCVINIFLHLPFSDYGHMPFSFHPFVHVSRGRWALYCNLLLSLCTCVWVYTYIEYYCISYN